MLKQSTIQLDNSLEAVHKRRLRSHKREWVCPSSTGGKRGFFKRSDYFTEKNILYFKE